MRTLGIMFPQTLPEETRDLTTKMTRLMSKKTADGH